MKKGCGCWKTERDRRNRRSRKNGTDDGGAPRRFAASCGGDRMAKQTTADAPIPLCPPTPSLGHMWDIEKAGRNRALRFPADALRSDEKLRPQCKHRAAALSSFPLPAFSAACAVSSLTGRRLKGPVREKCRLGREEDVVWLAGNGVVAFRRLMLNYPKTLILDMI